MLPASIFWYWVEAKHNKPYFFNVRCCSKAVDVEWLRSLCSQHRTCTCSEIARLRKAVFSLSLYICVYIYIYIYIYTLLNRCACIYIYIYIHTLSEEPSTPRLANLRRRTCPQYPFWPSETERRLFSSDMHASGSCHYAALISLRHFNPSRLDIFRVKVLKAKQHISGKHTILEQVKKERAEQTSWSAHLSILTVMSFTLACNILPR